MEWRTTLWESVDVDTMLDACKKMQREVNILPKGVRNWNCYLGLQDVLNNMMISLPLISDLGDPSMRTRHWQQLMSICGQTFVMDDKFCLNDLLKLNLHHYADAVGDTVDKARNELKIENPCTQQA